MRDNSAKMGELAKRFDLTSMSVDQLKKRLKTLKKDFETTSKAADPKRYKELRGEINKGSLEKRAFIIVMWLKPLFLCGTWAAIQIGDNSSIEDQTENLRDKFFSVRRYFFPAHDSNRREYTEQRAAGDKT